jgi:hypothetical protein
MKPVLIYTLPQTGSNFLSWCFNHVFENVVMTHNKDRANTDGEEINYKAYYVFVSVRKPQDTIKSSLSALIEKDKVIPEPEILVREVEVLIKKQTDYFIDILNNKKFFIMTFESFTKNFKASLFKIMDNDNNKFLVMRKDILKKSLDLEDALESIIKQGKEDPIRYPREKSLLGAKEIDMALKNETIKEKLIVLEALYRRVLERSYYQSLT